MPGFNPTDLTLAELLDPTDSVRCISNATWAASHVGAIQDGLESPNAMTVGRAIELVDTARRYLADLRRELMDPVGKEAA